MFPIWSYTDKVYNHFEIEQSENLKDYYFLLNDTAIMEARYKISTPKKHIAKQYYKAMQILMKSHPKWKAYLKEVAEALRNFYKIDDSKITDIVINYDGHNYGMPKIENVTIYREILAEGFIGKVGQYIRERVPFLIVSADKQYPDELVDAENIYFKNAYNIDLWHVSLDELPQKLLDNPEDLKQLKALVEIIPIAKKIKEETEGIDDPKKKKQIKTLYHKKIDKARKELEKKTKKKSSTNENKSDEEFDYNYIAKKIDEINKTRRNRLLKVMKEKFDLNGLPISGGYLGNEEVYIPENSYIFLVDIEHPLHKPFIKYHLGNDPTHRATLKFIDFIKFFGHDSWISQDYVFAFIKLPFPDFFISYYPHTDSGLFYALLTSDPAHAYKSSRDWTIKEIINIKENNNEQPREGTYFLKKLEFLYVQVDPFIEKSKKVKNPLFEPDKEKVVNSYFMRGYFESDIHYIWNDFLALDLDDDGRPILIYLKEIPSQDKSKEWIEKNLKQLGFSLRNDKWVYVFPTSVKNMEQIYDSITDIIFYLHNMYNVFEKGVIKKIDIDKIKDTRQYNEEISKIELMNKQKVSLFPYLEKAKARGKSIFKTPIDVIYATYKDLIYDIIIKVYPKLKEKGLDEYYILVVDMATDGNPLFIIGKVVEAYPTNANNKKERLLNEAKIDFIKNRLGYSMEEKRWVKKVKAKNVEDLYNKVMGDTRELNNYDFLIDAKPSLLKKLAQEI